MLALAIARKVFGLTGLEGIFALVATLAKKIISSDARISLLPAGVVGVLQNVCSRN